MLRGSETSSEAFTGSLRISLNVLVYALYTIIGLVITRLRGPREAISVYPSDKYISHIL
jgi:hypothetical protein